MEFQWVLVFDLGISKGCHTILQNFCGWKLVFSGISEGKVTNLKIPERGFQKSISSTPPVWIFSGISQWTGKFHSKSQITVLCDNFSMAIANELFQKKFQTRRKVEDMFFFWGGILKKYNVEIPAVNQKELEFPEGWSRKSWFLALEVV